jgi:hypothetical protein
MLPQVDRRPGPPGYDLVEALAIAAGVVLVVVVALVFT